VEKCRICNKEYKNFISLGLHIRQIHKISPKEYYDKFLKKENEGTCLECGKPTNFTSVNKGYCKFCSTSCGTNSDIIKSKVIQNNLKKYGVTSTNQIKEVKDKKIQACLDKHGVKNVSQIEEIKNKKIQTCLEHFGSEYPAQNVEIRKKQVDKCLEHFGVLYPMQYEGIKKKSKETCLQKYGVENPFQNEEIKEKYKETCLEKYGVEHYHQTKESRKRMLNGGATYIQSFIQNPSKPQVELFNLVKTFHEETILNFPSKGKSGNHFSLDIAIPSLKIDIEYDGSYFHPLSGPKFEKDQKRQKDLEEAGWKFLRYRDYIPTLEELERDIWKIQT